MHNIKPSKLFYTCLISICCLTTSLSLHAGRIAVFNPEKGTDQKRFTINIDFYNRLSNFLVQNKYEVLRLTAKEISTSDALDATTIDALFLEGVSVPRDCIPAIKKFTAEGGILVSTGGAVPLLIAIESDKNGDWQLSPPTPRFSWQTSQLHDHFGFQYIYNPLMLDQGRDYSISPLLETYLPDATAPKTPIKQNWLVSKGEGVFYPLINVTRFDEANVTPQAFIAQNGDVKGIFTLSSFLTDNSRPDEWAHGEEMLLALTKIAVDLKQGTLKLDADASIQIPSELPPPEPLQTRIPTGSVDPENATVLKRWGNFNGSSLDLKTSALPSKLLPGEQVTLSLPSFSDASAYLRIRFAYNATHAGIKAQVGDDTVLNEIYVYNDSTGESNHAMNLYSGAAVELTRLIFLPMHGSELTLSNPGTQAIFLDAVQIEERTLPNPDRWTGTGNGGYGLKPGQQNQIPLEISGKWSVLRVGAFPHKSGPLEDPNRWDEMKTILNNTLERSGQLNLVIAYTPEWAAISPERYEEALQARRPRTVPPDFEKYAEIIEWVLDNYQDHVVVYEIWNEPDLQQFWRGTQEEYLRFTSQIVDLIIEKDPDAKIITAGLAHSEPQLVKRLRDQPFAEHISMVATHPYIAESVCWDIPHGKLQGTLYAMGDPIEIYCNESGFVWRPAEWFKGDWTEERQASALNTAMARLLHGDLAKVSTFHGGGDHHQFGMYDIDGNPRPSAAPFEDYVKISQVGAQRLDVSFAPAAGDFPLQGIYFAGSQYPDGRQAMVVNPAESFLFAQKVKIRSKVDPDLEFTASAQANGEEVPVTLSAHDGYVEIQLSVNTRTVIELVPTENIKEL